jgi:enoyl-CoA hydratase/carnithine racemase
MTHATSTELVRAERRGPVLVLTLNRPERLNASTDALEDRYFARLDAAEDDPAVRAIVVTGAGRGFCAGADMSDLERAATNGGAEAQLRSRPRPRFFPRTVRKPMIAAINGAAVGLGLVEALYCDLRFATPDAKLSTTFARPGLIAEYGISWLLPRLVGYSTALDLLLSGRVIAGKEAQRLGLVDRVSEPERLLDDGSPTRRSSRGTARRARWPRSRPRSRPTSTARSPLPSRAPRSCCSAPSTGPTSKRACTATSNAARPRSHPSTP